MNRKIQDQDNDDNKNNNSNEKNNMHIPSASLSLATLLLAVPAAVRAVTWNGAPVALRVVDVSLALDAGGAVKIVQGELQFSRPDIAVPDLDKAQWKIAGSLPEIQDGFHHGQHYQAD